MKSLLLALSIITVITASAQSKRNISGTVKDSTQQKAIAYASVFLYKKGQTIDPIKSTYTNTSGKFSLQNIDTGSYSVAVVFTGFKEVMKDITLNDANAELNDLVLSPAAANLQGVTVSSRKPLIEQTDDKISFNVENDPTAKTQTALDILRKTPFVTVDGDDNISVNGQSNFKVLLNGRETSMFAQNVKEALKGFPGATILKIEVITSPSAKYDAEGVGGIINIITKKKLKGYNGSVGAYYSSNKWYNLNGNLSAKIDRLGLSASYFAGGSNNVHTRQSMETVPFVTTSFQRRMFSGESVRSNFWNYGNVELSYEIDSTNSLSLYASANGGFFKQDINQALTTEYASAPNSTGYYHAATRNEWPLTNFGTDYIRKFKSNPEKEFSIRFNGELGKMNLFNNSEQDNPGTDRFVRNSSIAHNDQFTLQSDYILPLKNNQKIEGGVKGIFRKANSVYSSLIRYTASDDFKLNPSNTDEFNYSQNVYSIYGNYNFKLGKTSIRLGARAEGTQVDGDFTSSNTKVQQDYFNVMPNLMVSTKFSNAYTLVFNYTQRLQRPYIWNLNPFVSNNDSLNISYGNPDLDAQVIHSVSIQNRLMKNGTFYSINLTGSYSNNQIARYASFDPATGVTRTTSANIGREYQLSLGSNLNTKLNPNWSLNMFADIRFNAIQNKLVKEEKNSGLGGNANINSSYSIKKLSINAYFGFYRNPVGIQMSSNTNFWYGTGLGYKLFKEKLTLNLSVVNFLSKEYNYKYTVTDKYFRTSYVNTQPYRGVSLGVTWNFGKLSENVSKKKGVNNDDLIGGGSSSN
jgi:outer membrane receptor for ferrienterochelin and colicin